MAAQRATETNDRAETDLAIQVERLRDDISGIAKALNELGKSKAEEVAGSAADRAARITAAGRRQAEAVVSSINGLEVEASDYVRSRPLQSLAVAAALGLLVGLVTRRE